MSNAKKATVESLTDYYKQHYYEGEYSVGDLCVMLARAEVHNDSEVIATREVCDHADWTNNVYSDGIYFDMGYRYCPKCGEKL